MAVCRGDAMRKGTSIPDSRAWQGGTTGREAQSMEYFETFTSPSHPIGGVLHEQNRGEVEQSG